MGDKIQYIQVFLEAHGIKFDFPLPTVSALSYCKDLVT